MHRTFKAATLILCLAALSGCAELHQAREPAPEIGDERNDLKASPCACGPAIPQPNYQA